MSRLEVDTCPVSFQASEPLVEQLDQIADDQGMNRSEKIRELIKREVERHQDDDEDLILPESEQLRDCYRKLLHLSEEKFEGGGLRLTAKQARNQLYDQNTPKDSVMDDLIRPLKSQGFVDIDPAMERVWIVVRPLESQPEQPSAQTDDQPAVQEAD